MWNNQSDYLRAVQYKNSSNLGARIRLHHLFNTNTYGAYSWLFDLLMAVAGTRSHILEVGCGRADLWAANRDRLPHDWRVTLTDFSPGMLNDAQSQLGESAQHFRWETAQAEALPFADQSFDVVQAHYMLYHVADRQQAIAELRRVLKPHGVLLTMTLGLQHMAELKELLRDFQPEVGFEHNNTIRTFSLENGAAQLQSAFADVQLIEYPCDLLVTELEPLIHYIFSMDYFLNADEAEHERLRAFVQARFAAAEGRFFIRKQSGLFVSRGMA
jgi:SAM-dependent methyltransferase